MGQPSWAPVITKKGLQSIGQLEKGDHIWTENGWKEVSGIWSRVGVTDPVYEYETACGYFYGTKDHNVMSYNDKYVVHDIGHINLLFGPEPETEIVFDNDLVTQAITIAKNAINNKEMEMPHDLVFANDHSITCSLLRGLYVVGAFVRKGSKIDFKCHSKKLATQMQIMLGSIGIPSYITRKPRNNHLSVNYRFDLFKKYVGFLNDLDNKRLDQIIKTYANKKLKVDAGKIIGRQQVSNEIVFDLTIDGSDTYWSGGLNVCAG